jgi:3-carboxy-cis,cis-muconate cycloisomerase
VGGWQAEWPALSSALAYAGGAAAAARRTLDGLVVDSDLMARNLNATGGLVAAERVSFLLSEHLGRPGAHELVGEAVERARVSGRPLADELEDDPRVEALHTELDAALDPSTYLGSAESFVDRALELYRDEAGRR